MTDKLHLLRLSRRAQVETANKWILCSQVRVGRVGSLAWDENIQGGR